MAKTRTRKSKPELPVPGTVFLMPLADGRYGACRVLREWESSDVNVPSLNGPAVLVATTAWIGTEQPDLLDPRLREILHLTHHSWKNSPAMNWVSNPPPEGYREIGVLEQDDHDRTCRCMSYGGWSGGFQILMQWRWEHDRENVLHEDAEKEEREARQREEAERQRKAARAALTLAQLRNKRRFGHWKDAVPAKATTDCRKVFRETIDALVELGPKPAEQKVLPILQACVERLNELDVKHGNFIDTPTREDLCEEFDEIVFVSGLGERPELADEWREW